MLITGDGDDSWPTGKRGGESFFVDGMGVKTFEISVSSLSWELCQEFHM